MISNFFNPKTIAVVGASNHKGKVGYSFIKNLKSFKGKVFPVNLKEKTIQGLKCYNSVLDIKEKIDLAVIAIPIKGVKQVLQECVKKNIKSVIINTAGFSEAGNKKAEQELLKISGKKTRILGPNCFGVVNTKLNLDTSFAITTPKKGNIAFISQSGALWSAISDWSLKKHFGFSKFVSLGNMSDVDFSDLIEYFNQDKETKAIVCYIELLKQGKRFMKVAQKSKKPIIALKVGKSKAGTKAALSHTGSLAGSFEIYKAAFKQSNVMLADTITQAFDLAKFFENQEKPKNNRVIILTNAGGPGALSADYFDKNNLNVVDLPKEFIKKLDLGLPKAWSHNNPIDVVGDAQADRYKTVLDALSEKKFSKMYDIVILLLTPQQMSQSVLTAKELIKFKEKNKDKVVVSCLIGGESILEARAILEEKGIPYFFEPERAANMLGKIINKK